MPWVDHLRTLVIVLVVNLHACVTYSHVGGWFILSEHEPTLREKIPFIIWMGTLQSFFMGLLFFISGYFAAKSLARRGSAAFVRERLFRLGLPALLFMLVINPLVICLWLNPWGADFGPAAAFYRRFVLTGRWLGASGPLWFVLALLLFCLGLAGWRLIRPNAAPVGPRGAGAVPSLRRLALWAVGIALASFLVRLVQPFGTSVLNFQLCFFPQYIVFFGGGVHAARHDWLQGLAASRGAARAGWVGLLTGPLVLLALLGWFQDRNGIPAYFGGWHWEAFGLACWEQYSALGISLGLLALFSRKLNRDGPFLRWLADRSFAVYVLHAPVLIALMMAFRSLPQNPYLLSALLTVSGLVVSFAVADLARRLPGLKTIV